MNNLKLKVTKVLKNAIVPEKSGFHKIELFAASEELKSELTGPQIIYDTGLKIEIPEGFVGLIMPISEVSANTTLMLGSGVDIIDSTHTGTVKLRYRNINPVAGKKFKVGDKVGQLMLVPVPRVELVEVLDAEVS